MKILAVTACPTGIAHTYMAAEALQKAADKLGLKIKVETQGAMGLENVLTAREIAGADLVLIASDIEIEQKERFLPDLVAGKALAGFGLTEPDAGSNTLRIKTFAKKSLTANTAAVILHGFCNRLI